MHLSFWATLRKVPFKVAHFAILSALRAKFARRKVHLCSQYCNARKLCSKPGQDTDFQSKTKEDVLKGMYCMIHVENIARSAVCKMPGVASDGGCRPQSVVIFHQHQLLPYLYMPTGQAHHHDSRRLSQLWHRVLYLMQHGVWGWLHQWCWHVGRRRLLRNGR